MSDELALPGAMFTDRAVSVRAPLCRDCGWHGPWVDACDRDDTAYGDAASGHAAETGHRKIADVKVVYSPGEAVDLAVTGRKARRALGRRDV